jgi:metal-responsive CopG/Arc/MetJ family transcriptional regulator
MKTAISIPDEIFADAETLGNKLGLSRSELYARAVKSFIKKYWDRSTTQTLNQVYSDQESHVAPEIHRAQLKSLVPEKW